MPRHHTDRLEEILDTLSAGATTLPYLYREYFKKEDGKMVSKRTFNDFMKRLEKGEYIRIGTYDDRYRRNGNIRFAVLLARGADILCRKRPNREREHVRMAFPTRRTLTHEIVLAHIVRLIRKESKTRGTFQIEYIFDEHHMKRIVRYRHGKGVKQMYYPDLRVKIHPLMGSAMDINIELDAGQKTQIYWTKKIQSFPELNIIIALDPHRLRLLEKYAQAAKLIGSICLVSYADFEKSGLTYWLATFREAIGKRRVFIHSYREEGE